MNDTPPHPASSTTPSPPKKSVSFPLPAPEHPAQTPIQAKILARKPTPFNSDLAASIRHSGFSRSASDPHPDQMALDQEDDDQDLDFGDELEEEHVDVDMALLAQQMSSSHAPSSHQQAPQPSLPRQDPQVPQTGNAHPQSVPPEP